MRATFKKALIALGVFMCSAFLVYGAGNTTGMLLKSSPYTTINATSDAALLKLVGASGALVLDGIVTKVKTKAETKAGTPRDATIYNSYLDNYLSLVDNLDDVTKTAYGSDYSAIFQYIYPRVYALKVEDKSTSIFSQLQGYIDSAAGTKSPTTATPTITLSRIITSVGQTTSWTTTNTTTLSYSCVRLGTSPITRTGTAETNRSGLTETWAALLAGGWVPGNYSCTWIMTGNDTQKTYIEPTFVIPTVTTTSSSSSSSSSSSGGGQQTYCNGTKPPIGEGMQENGYSASVAGPTTANTTWKFSNAGGSCTVSCKSGYMQDGANESCKRIPTYPDMVVKVYDTSGNPLASGEAFCHSISLSKQMPPNANNGFAGYATFPISNGQVTIRPGMCGVLGGGNTNPNPFTDDIEVSFGTSASYQTTTLPALKNNPVFSLKGKDYSFSFENPYMNLVKFSITGAGANSKQCAGPKGTCNDASKYVTPPSPWKYDNISDTWSFSSEVTWPAGQYDVGVMKDGKILKIESVQYTGFLPGSKPITANDYCPGDGRSVASPCNATNVTIENASTGDGYVRLRVHTPNKSGWKSCFSYTEDCKNVTSHYAASHSAFENNADWSWNESTKTWSCDIYWPDLPAGNVTIGVASDRYVFTTKSFPWTKYTPPTTPASPTAQPPTTPVPAPVVDGHFCGGGTTIEYSCNHGNPGSGWAVQSDGCYHHNTGVACQ